MVSKYGRGIHTLSQDRMREIYSFNGLKIGWDIRMSYIANKIWWEKGIHTIVTRLDEIKVFIQWSQGYIVYKIGWYRGIRLVVTRQVEIVLFRHWSQDRIR